MISIRFGNGYGSVSVPDFLEYFTTPPQIRVAKASTSAVRMSLDLLQLEMGMDETVDVTNSIQDPTKVCIVFYLLIYLCSVLKLGGLLLGRC